MAKLCTAWQRHGKALRRYGKAGRRRTWLSNGRAEHGAAAHSNGKAEHCKAELSTFTRRRKMAELGTQYEFVLTFTEQLLGTVPKDPKIYGNFIESKAPESADGKETETVPVSEESGWTGFHEINGQPFLYDYIIKGFLKDACSSLRRVPGTLSHKLQAYKKIIDGQMFPSPRKILLDLNGQPLTQLERPLRAQTAQGERVALVRSDAAPIGTVITFRLLSLNVKKNQLEEWFAYGMLRGMGQWRNASFGRFSYEMNEC